MSSQERIDDAAASISEAAGKLLDVYGLTAGSVAVRWVLIVDAMSANGPCAVWGCGSPEGFTAPTHQVLGLLEYAKIEITDPEWSA